MASRTAASGAEPVTRTVLSAIRTSTAWTPTTWETSAVMARTQWAQLMSGTESRNSFTVVLLRGTDRIRRGEPVAPDAENRRGRPCPLPVAGAAGGGADGQRPDRGRPEVASRLGSDTDPRS